MADDMRNAAVTTIRDAGGPLPFRFLEINDAPGFPAGVWVVRILDQNQCQLAAIDVPADLLRRAVDWMTEHGA